MIIVIYQLGKHFKLLELISQDITLYQDYFKINSFDLEFKITILTFKNFFFLSFFIILGPYPWHMEVPRLGV